MAKKKHTAGEAATTDPPEPTAAEITTTAPAPAANGNGGNGNGHETNGNGDGNGEKRRPVFKVGPILTDKDNSVEAAVWDRVVTSGDRTFTVYSVTCHANWRDTNGQWNRSGNFRGSQLYALVYCLQRASDWILSMRDQSCPS